MDIEMIRIFGPFMKKKVLLYAPLEQSLQSEPSSLDVDFFPVRSENQ